jgi:hypothetical protein
VSISNPSDLAVFRKCCDSNISPAGRNFAPESSYPSAPRGPDGRQ